jgi:hypothetical protein
VITGWVLVNEAGHLVAGREEVVLGVVRGKGLGHEHLPVVDERVDSAEVGDDRKAMPAAGSDEARGGSLAMRR